MSFTTYFNHDLSKRYQKGFTLKSKDLDDTISLEKWTTDFEKNTYEKELTDRSSSLAKNGEREGRNEVGELWHEKWYLNNDGLQGWERWTEAEGNDGNQYKWGEGQQNQGHVIGLKISRW